MKPLILALFLLACNGRESGDPETRYSKITQDVIPAEVLYSVETRVFTGMGDYTDVELVWESIVETVDTVSVKEAEMIKAQAVKDSIDLTLN